MNIAVVGTGYVGLVVGACFAENGNTVVCVDKDAAKVRALQKGKIPIYEPGLEELVTRNRQEGRLTFTTTLPRAVRASQVIFIAVGTPEAEDGSADLQHVLGVARDVPPCDEGYRSSSTRAPSGRHRGKVREAVAARPPTFSVVATPSPQAGGCRRRLPAAVSGRHRADDPRGAE